MPNEGMAISRQKHEGVDLWDKRLVHVSFGKMQEIHYLSSKVNFMDFGHYDSCLRAKQTRLRLSMSEIIKMWLVLI